MYEDEALVPVKATSPFAVILPNAIVLAADEFFMFAVMSAFVQALMSPRVLPAELPASYFKVTVPPDHTHPAAVRSVMVALIAPTAVRFPDVTADPVTFKGLSSDPMSLPDHID